MDATDLQQREVLDAQIAFLDEYLALLKKHAVVIEYECDYYEGYINQCIVFDQYNERWPQLCAVYKTLDLETAHPEIDEIQLALERLKARFTTDQQR